MTDPIRDPEGIETRHLLEIADLRGARVLEVGSGEGRLTWRYAAQAAQVVALDTDGAGLATARRARPADLARRVSFLRAAGEALPFRTQAFDVVLLSWSL